MAVCALFVTVSPTKNMPLSTWVLFGQYEISLVLPVHRTIDRRLAAHAVPRSAQMYSHPGNPRPPGRSARTERTRTVVEGSSRWALTFYISTLTAAAAAVAEPPPPPPPPSPTKQQQQQRSSERTNEAAAVSVHVRRTTYSTGGGGGDYYIASLCVCESVKPV